MSHCPTKTDKPVKPSYEWGDVEQMLNLAGIHCGIPLGIDEEEVVTNMPFLKRMQEEFGTAPIDHRIPEYLEMGEGVRWRHIHTWETSRQYRGKFWVVAIFQDEATKKIVKLMEPVKKSQERLDVFMKTGAMRSQYCLTETELRAQEKLFRELSDSQKDQYIVMDSFVETGKSGVRYYLRKNRPTLAFRTIEVEGQEVDHFLASLCLHPLAYYRNCWAGALPPSDEVLVHLLMIRSDEKYYWRKANQIPIDQPSSGV